MHNSSPFTDQNNALFKDRLNRIAESLRTLTLSTVEEYQAEVYSRVNAVLSRGLAMTPLAPVSSEGPAVIGDVSNNYTILNNDADDIANELLRIEDSAADLFNLSATSLNQLRQAIREFVYESNHQRYSEEFLNNAQLSSYTVGLDYNAGLATNPLVSDTDLTSDATFSIGPNTVGGVDPSSSVSYLTDNRPDTSLILNGTTLELLLTFSSPKIINRITINLDTYAGLEISTLTTSPDGTLVQDILSDLGVDRILMDGTSNKFSGDVIIDFPPRHVQTMRLIVLDRVGQGLISFRSFACSSRTYSSTGQLTSAPILVPTGTVVFTSMQNVFSPFVSITHQISYDGTQFTAINPGDLISLSSSPFFYRAVLERSSSRFDSPAGPLVQTPLDPIGSPSYTLASSTSTPLGTGIIERTLQVNSVTGPIVLRDTPMPNTLTIQEGSLILSLANGDYSFVNNTITFPGSVTGLTISYQTSSLGNAAVKDLEHYYTPLLYEVKFETE